MESGDGISGDEIDQKELEALSLELALYEKMLSELQVGGEGMTGDSNGGFQYDAG